MRSSNEATHHNVKCKWKHKPGLVELTAHSQPKACPKLKTQDMTAPQDHRRINRLGTLHVGLAKMFRSQQICPDRAHCTNLLWEQPPPPKKLNVTYVQEAVSQA